MAKATPKDPIEIKRDEKLFDIDLFIGIILRNCKGIFLNYMLKKIKTWPWFITYLLFIGSCMPDEFKTVGLKVDAINPEYAIPLVSDDLSISNLIGTGGTFIKKETDGFISLVYRGQIFSTTAEKVVVLPDQNFNQVMSLNAVQANALMNGQNLTISSQSAHSISIGSREIDSIWFKAGALVASIASEIKTSGNLKITLEDAKNSGVSLSVNVPFNYGGTTPVIASNSTLFDGYKWNMTKGGLGYNRVNINYELTLNATTQIVNSGDQMTIDLGLKGLNFSQFYGYVGQVNLLNEAETIDLSIFDNSTNASIFIEDPKVKIIFGNSFGVPIKAGFSKLATFSPGIPETDITGIPDPLPIPAPTLSQIGQILYDSVLIDKSTSNIKTAINQKPKHLIFKAFIDLNPNGKQQRNFLTDKSQLKIILDVEFPLYGSVRNFMLEGEKEIEFKMPDQEIIEEITLRFTGLNGYPIDLFTQVYLMDSMGVAFDSLFNNQSYQFIEAASVGLDGKVTTATKKTTDIVFDILRAKRLSRLAKVKLRAQLGTTSQGGTYPSVKFYSTYVLGIKIGVKAKLKLDAGK